jgi:hypothetical protein
MDRFDVVGAADALDAALRRVAVADRAEHEKAYLKSDLVHYGASVPAIRQVTTAFLVGHQDLDREAIMALAEELWGRGVHELRAAAVELLGPRKDRASGSTLREASRYLPEDQRAVLLSGRGKAPRR